MTLGKKAKTVPVKNLVAAQFNNLLQWITGSVK